MIEPDINERMARFAPSQNVGNQPDPIALEVLAETEADAPPPMAPGFDPIAVQIARESQEEMMATLRGASAVNPDQAARAQRIGQQVGIGQDVVLRNMAEMEREVVARQAIDRDLMRTAPNLARFLGQREFATIAHDDIDNLTKAERVFKWFAGIPKDVEEGLSRAVATSELGKMYEAQMRGVEPTWLDRVVIQSYNDELGRLSKESGFIESAANIVGIQAEMAAQVPESVMLGATMGGGWGMVGGPLAPATVPAGMAFGAGVGLTVGMAKAAYVLEAGNAYGSMVEEADAVLRQRRDAGEIDAATYESDMREVRDRARNIATGVGVVNAGLELVGLKMIAAPFREAFKGAVRRATAQAVTQQTTRAALGRAGTQYGLAIAGETGTEVMQEIVTVAGEELNSYGADLPLKMSTEEGRAEVAQRLVDTAIDTAKGMTLVGLPGPVVNYYVNTRKVAEARKAERFFTDLADVSKQDKVAERSPAAYERFLAAQAEGTQAETIYVDARTMQSVLQQARRADPALTDEVIDEAMPGVRQQIDQQVETGGDVTIPTATFGARLARTDLGRSLIPHMRLNPDALSVDEAVRYRGQMEERRQEAMRLMQEQDAAGTSFSQEAETVRDDVRARLEAAGRSREEADVGSLLYRDFVVTNAARMGMTPAQFQAERGLREIVGAEVGVGPLEQADQFDQAGNRNIDTPEFKAWNNRPEVEGGNNKLNDESGKPIRLFHGTPRGGFVAFDPARIGLNTRYGRGGFSFTTNRQSAEAYAYSIDAENAQMSDMVAAANRIFETVEYSPLLEQEGIWTSGDPTVYPEFDVQMMEDVDDLSRFINNAAAIVRRTGQEAAAMQLEEVVRTAKPPVPEVFEVYVYVPQNARELTATRETIGQVLSGIDVREQPGQAIIVNMPNDEKVVIVADPTSIKSVNNRGTWSRTTANIMEQAATMDAEYMAAVERGDMDTAQRMVDEASEALGFTIEAFHGTPEGGFTEFRDSPRGLYFTNKKSLAAGYTYRRVPWLSPGTNPTIYRTKLRMTNPLRIDAGGARNNNIPFPGREYKRTVFGNLPAGAISVEEAARLAFEAGHDGIIIDNVLDSVDMADRTRSTVYVIPRKEQVKSADPVTRDEAGNVIPLSRRFDITSPRIFEQAAAGPARGGFDPKRLTVLLNKQADLSTFLHELSHYFLTTYSDIAASGKASPELLADLDTTLQWFGIAGDTPQARLAAWNSMSLDQQRPFHEQFAYSFEVYAFDGKAPSAELRGVFERFSSYLKRVYKSIRDELNAIYRREFGKDLPILTGEVRQVMDRMLASDAAIRRQQAVESIKPAFLTREQAGVDEAQWAEHQAALADAEAIAINDMTKASLRTVQWMSNARSRIVKEMQSKHDAKRKEVREEVAAQVRMEPAYRAQAYLRYGKFIDADGQEVAVDGPHKLDLDTVKQMYELEPEALRPDVTAMARGKYGFVGKDGLNPDMIAETFGYSSGDQMIRAVMGLKPIKETIDERTDAVMVERFSDLNSKAAVDAEVQKALHNEARARFVAIELKFAAKATEPTRVIVEAARQAARDIIAAKKVRDVRPSEHVAAEARAAREAVTAGQFPDPSATAQAASTRAYNEAIAAGKTEAEAGAEAMQAGLRAADAARARIKEFESRYPGATREQIIIRAKRQEMYQNQLAAEALRVKDEVDKDVKYLRRVLRDENVKRMGADATDQVAELLSRFDVAAVPLKILDRRKQTLSAWMEAKADGGIVPDIAPELLEAGRRVNYREMTVAEFRDLVSAVKQIEYVGKNERKLQLAEERAEFEEKRDEIVTRIRATGRLRGLDIDPRSPLTNIGRTVSKLQAFAAAHLKAASIARVLDGGKDDGPLWNTVIRTANAAADMETRMRSEATAKLAEILKPVFALGNMGGKGMFFRSINRSLNREARIAIALNMGNAGNMQRLLDGEGWNMAQVQPVLESLTAAEWNAVQQVWDFLETYRPLVAAKERRLYGKEPNWVEPQPLTVRTSDGQTLTLRGGYYPVKYDPVASDRVATFDEVQEAKDALRGTYTAATTRRSFTKARAEKVVGRPILYTLDAAFSGVNDVIHDLAWHEWLISTNRLLRDEKFANAVRETRGPEFLRQLREWAKANAAGDRSANVEGVLSWLRQGISASGLGFNVMSAALQITGFNQSVVRVGAKWVGLGIAEFTASPFATSQFVREKSSFMAERQRTQFRELNELRNTVRGKGAGVRKVLAQAYVAMMTMQRAVDTPTWVGAYRKALAAGKDDATSVALADQAVKDSQGSGLTSDLAAIERGGPGLKLFTVFYSYMNTVYNMAAVQTYTSRGRGKLAADYVMLMVVPVVLGHAIKSLLTPDAGDDDFDPEALARKLAAEELSFLMGTMVVAREFGGAAQLLTGAEGARMGYGGPAGVRAIGEAYNLATQTGQMEFDRAFVRSAINTLGAFTGLPSAQINRTIDGVQAILEGEVEGVGAVVAPLTGVKK